MANVAVSKGASALAGAASVRVISPVFCVISVSGSLVVDMFGSLLADASTGLLFGCFLPRNRRRKADIIV